MEPINPGLQAHRKKNLIHGSVTWSEGKMQRVWRERQHRWKFRRDEPMSQTYLYGAELQDLAVYGASVKTLVTSQAAEKVFEVPELRNMIWEGIIGKGSKAALVDCMILSQKSFSSVVLVLYEAAPSDLARAKTALVSTVSMIVYHVLKSFDYRIA